MLLFRNSPLTTYPCIKLLSYFFPIKSIKTLSAVLLSPSFPFLPKLVFMPRPKTTDALKVLVLAHDLSDATILKRVAMLRQGGAVVTVAGFRRTGEPISRVEGCPAYDFGQTFNARFLQRLGMLLRTCALMGRYRALFASADVILARNLEMLALGVRGQGLSRHPPVLVYEVLDIHRLLLRRDFIGKGLRRIEGWLARRACALLTSSPAYIEHYFNVLSHLHVPIHLIENKTLDWRKNTHVCSALSLRKPGPPWIIGWFGILRCRQSLCLLKALAQASKGNIEVVLRGRPAFDLFDDFNKSVSETKGLNFFGPYNPDDLASIYQNVHFAWTIDKYEEDMNSSWLLPNRLYEGCAFGAVPIAENAVETGRFLERLCIGVSLANPLEKSLTSFFENLSAQRYQELEQAVRRLPAATWAHTADCCKDLVRFLASLV